MPVASASRSSVLSYVSTKQAAPIHSSVDHQLHISRPISPLRADPNTTFTSFNNEGHSQRYHEVKFTGDLSRVSWVWGAPSSLGRMLNKDEETIRIEVINEADAVGEGKMLNPYSDLAPRNNNIVEPALNADDTSHSIRSWRISEEGDESDPEEEDIPASFTARFPRIESPKPPESLQDVNNEYQHPNYSHTQFQDRASSASTNTLSYVSIEDEVPVEAAIHRRSAHRVYPSIHHFQQPEPVAAEPIPWDGDHHHHHEMSESYDDGPHIQPHGTHDPWGEIPHSGVEEERASFQEHGVVFPTFNEPGPSRLPPTVLTNVSPPNNHHQHQYQQHNLPPLSTGQPFIPQRLSRASSISIRSGYGKYREPVLPHTSTPSARQSQPITPMTPITPNVPAIPSTANNRSRFKFPIKLRDRAPNTKESSQSKKDLPKLPASRLSKKPGPGLKSRTKLVPQEQERVELRELDDGSSWVIYSH